MVKSKDEEKAIARELRRQGWSYGKIAKELRVSKGSVSGWCSDIELSLEQEAAINHRKQQWGDNNKGAKLNKQKGLEQRIFYQEAGRQKAKEKQRLHMIGCMLYWAEGGKSKRNSMDFANSDPTMIRIFIQFLREQLLVDDKLIKIRIHCHTQDEKEISRIKAYWLDLLQLEESNLERVNYKEGSEKRINRLENGVCSICVYRVEVLQHILGAIQEYGGFVNEEWLY